MKNAAVFFNAPGFDGYPFDEKDYRQSYRELGEKVERAGSRLFIVRSMQTYRGNHVFSYAWKYENNGFVFIDTPVKVDIIWNRGDFQGEKDCHVINEPSFGEICTNKWKTYQMFQALHPMTFLVNSVPELENAIAHLHSQTIVAKPVDREGGEGVHIGTANEIRAKVTAYPYLLQGFIDTSAGIKDIALSLHDFRIVSIGGKVILSYIREPQHGSLIANESRGGKITEVPVERIPPETLVLFRTVDLSLEHYKKRVYSLDMGLDKDNRWKIIEMNSQPGLDPSSKYEGAGRYIETMAGMLVE